jgi:hypothetical protein
MPLEERSFSQEFLPLPKGCAEAQEIHDFDFETTDVRDRMI